ncbi:calcium-dependent phosphoinositide phospholipase C [Kineococcus xinjiangensis]|uniref:Calcium-dependent phosphoinositide phospholipase C n=1 Tax=Kineococcus xinjiangensis TaxID=512762 RepID=A0A2S6IT73_9ACTN|nr:phosphatidylinositol-specific phospholipase C domain-containing protein [Kineococcus xinjiangensis]PPK97452.1 calcium-dependent phosphoinositide phospholipase C [Kineococcus xinjiangensis]
MRARPAATAAATLLTALAVGVDPAAAAGPRLSEVTTVGVHNGYSKSAYTYLAQGLDAGTTLLELDVWADPFSRRWRVSHDKPLGNDNNCVKASSPAQLYTGDRNQDLASCLDDLRLWLDAHPTAGPITVKVELKKGFDNRAGLGPDEFDAYVRRHLGSRVFRPADLLGGHPHLDAAARAGAWPSRAALAGRVVVELIPGTLEERNPNDTLWTDVEYASHLRALHAAGRFGEAQAFPAVHRAAPGDPRTRYADAGLRPWFVVFDGDAGAYASGGIDTSWYVRNHYLVVMTDAHAVAPAISATDPTEQQARERLRLLAGRGASVITSDWRALRGVLTAVEARR